MWKCTLCSGASESGTYKPVVTAHRAVAIARYEIRSIADQPIHSDSGTIFFPVM